MQEEGTHGNSYVFIKFNAPHVSMIGTKLHGHILILVQAHVIANGLEQLHFIGII